MRPEEARNQPRNASPDVIDPDVDLHDAAQRADRGQVAVVAACSLGGVIGAEARYGISRAMTHPPDAFPWATLLINVLGCLLIGVLMVVLTRVLRAPNHLLRPFLGVGVLGGFTTYSTFAVDAHQLLLANRPFVALAYVLSTLVLCAAAVYVGTKLPARLVRRERVDA